jgi:hypothetical protein
MTPINEHRPASSAGKAAAVLLIAVAGFQGLLAAGAPWGAAAYGGANPGVLPESLRASSAAPAAYLALAALAGTRLAATPIHRRFMYGSAALMTVGVITNIASPSFIERIIWTPVTMMLVIARCRTRRPAGASRPCGDAPVHRELPGNH